VRMHVHPHETFWRAFSGAFFACIKDVRAYPLSSRPSQMHVHTH
jgi:hypothetical protein